MSLRIEKSGIEGSGVFATRDYVEDETILSFTEKLVRPDDVQDEDHAIWIDENVWIETEGALRFCNHSCEANGDVDGGVIDGKVWVKLLAVRAIREGEEITLSYGYSEEDAVPCRCGTPSCKGIILETED